MGHALGGSRTFSAHWLILDEDCLLIRSSLCVVERQGENLSRRYRHAVSPLHCLRVFPP